jgi:hypothetical protein
VEAPVSLLRYRGILICNIIDIAKLVKDRLLKSNSRCESNVGEDNKGNVKKWSSFSYIGKEVMPIARILRKFNINVAFKTRNTVGKLLKHKHIGSDSDNGGKHDTCGVYKIKCGSCSSVYIDQTGRSFKLRFREHISDIVHNRCKMGYSQHILNSGHERAHSITELEILERQHKSPFLNTLENFHIFKCKKESNILNDFQFDMDNPIFEVIEQFSPR